MSSDSEKCWKRNIVTTQTDIKRTASISQFLSLLGGDLNRELTSVSFVLYIRFPSAPKCASQNLFGSGSIIHKHKQNKNSPNLSFKTRFNHQNDGYWILSFKKTRLNENEVKAMGPYRNAWILASPCQWRWTKYKGNFSLFFISIRLLGSFKNWIQDW